MNYIKQLEQKIDLQQRQLETYKNGLISILAYLELEKFQGFENNCVNPSDIRLRINEIRSEITNIEFYG